MQYLGLAIYAEGPTDYYFLRPLLQRLCEEICMHEAFSPVECSEVLALDSPESQKDASRAERILEAGRQARGAWRILFVHTDGAGDPSRAREQLAQPAIDALHEEFASEGAAVAVIPVRETESWAICDGEALRQVMGTTLADADLGLPATPAAVESMLDPKATLNAAFLATRPSGSRKRRGVSPMLNALGEQVSLTRLRELASFAALEAEVRQALRILHIV